MDIPQDLLKEYLLDTNEHIETIENTVVHLEKELSKDEINELFRAFHTIKGNSALVGVTEIRDISHATESMIGDVRNGLIPMTHDMADLTLQAVDVIKKMIKRVESGNYSLPIPAELIEKIQKYREEAKSKTAKPKASNTREQAQDKEDDLGGGIPQNMVVKTVKNLAIIELPPLFGKTQSGDLRSFLLGLQKKGINSVVFDFSGTSQLSREGFDVLSGIKTELENVGGKLASCGLKKEVLGKEEDSASLLNFRNSLKEAVLYVLSPA